MVEQKRSTESTHYDRESSPTKKIVVTPPSASSGSSTKYTSPEDISTSASDISPPPAISINLKKKKSTCPQPSSDQPSPNQLPPDRPSPEELNARTKKFNHEFDIMSKEERKACHDAYIAHLTALYGGELPEETPLKDDIDYDYEHGLGEFAPFEDTDDEK